MDLNGRSDHDPIKKKYNYFNKNHLQMSQKITLFICKVEKLLGSHSGEKKKRKGENQLDIEVSSNDNLNHTQPAAKRMSKIIYLITTFVHALC